MKSAQSMGKQVGVLVFSGYLCWFCVACADEKCTAVAFNQELAYVDAVQKGEQASVILSALMGDLRDFTNFSMLQVETYALTTQTGSAFKGPIVPGTYRIEEVETNGGEDLSFTNCSLCVVFVSECSLVGGKKTCERGFFATQGVVHIKSLGFLSGDRVEVQLSELKFKEISLETSEEKEGGEDLCLAETSLSARVQSGPVVVEPAKNTVSSCSQAGNGQGLGNNIADLTFTNCLGEQVALHSLGCGEAAKAIWLTSSAQWCGACLMYNPVYHALAEENDEIDFYVVLGQRSMSDDSLNSEASILASCAMGFGSELIEGVGQVPPEKILIDPGWRKTNLAMDNYGVQGIPYTRVLRGINMEYLWTHNANRSDGSLPLEYDALKEAAGIGGIVGWAKMIERINQLTQASQ